VTADAAARAAPGLRFVPGRRLALLALAPLPALLLPGYGLWVALGLDALLLMLAMLELRALSRAVPGVERVVGERLLLGVDNAVVLRLHNPTRLSLALTLRDDYPEGFAADQDELTLELPPYARRELSYQVTPSRRGRFEFGDMHLRIEGFGRLGAVLSRHAAAEPVHVYPNLRGPSRYELAARLGQLHSVGVRAVRRLGGGGDFEQLREYVPGDPYRDLDWKASAKRHRPITRVFGKEQSQTVIVMLDAGRLMATRLDELSKLDHAINAALLLSFVALRGGDKVGLVVFADDVATFVPPGRGHSHYRRILESLYAVEASAAYVDFRRVVEFVRVRVPRRALLVLFSDLLDDSQALPMAEQASLLRAKHLPVCVTMNDPVAERLAEGAVQGDAQAYRRAAAADILAEREAIKLQLRKAGVGLVEASAAQLAIATVNRYLEIKGKHAL
jgi:uncharacterized protein (DUF58 family)